MFDGIEFRGFPKTEQLAEFSGVWNGLTDDWHPTNVS